MEKNLWRDLFVVREQVLPELEKARQAKTIGKALEARLILPQKLAVWNDGPATTETLRELLNVSQLDFQKTEATQVHRAEGQKCERCWHWEKDVGSHTKHPTICARCVAAVEPVA